MARTAKLFTNGRSQAVRLPAEFRFEGDEVLIRKDEKTGDVILSEASYRKAKYQHNQRLCEAPAVERRIKTGIARW